MDSSAEALKRLVFRSAAKAPESIVLNFKKNWEDLPYMPEVFEKVFLNDPVSIGKHLEFQSETSTGAIIMKLLRKSSQPQIIKFIDALDEISLSKKINENLYIKYITNLDRIALIYSSQSDTKLNEALKLATSKDFLQFLIELNKELPGVMELELEDFYKRGIWVTKRTGEFGAKKKYALINHEGKLKIRGFETVRRNWSLIAKEVQEKVLNIISSYESTK